MRALIIMIVGCLLCCQKVTSNPVYEGMEKNYQDTREKWEKFEKMLTWYLETSQPKPIEPTCEKEDLLAELFNEKWAQEHQDLVKTLDELHTHFHAFAEHLAEALSYRFHGVTRSYARSDVIKEATVWYVSLMEHALMCESHQEEYTAHLNRQKNAPARVVE